MTPKYRVRRGLFGTSVLQVLKENVPQDLCGWVDVPYDRAPRRLGLIDTYEDRIHDLEIENAELTVKVELK